MIFCVEDDPNIRELEVYTLKSTGFPALGLESGDELFKALETVLPQLIILDIMLPGEDGMAILKRLRRDKRTADIPVIMATAKGSEFDKVHGLDSGADDYIAKPFGMMEMVSRVKAVLRRYVKEDKTSELTNGLITMDIARHMVFVNGEEVVLTYKEFEVLHKLMERPGQVFTREQLLTDIWGYDFDGETRTVDVHVRTLRQKLWQSCMQFLQEAMGIGFIRSIMKTSGNVCPNIRMENLPIWMEPVSLVVKKFCCMMENRFGK